MNRHWSLILLFLVVMVKANAQENMQKWSQQTHLRVGFYHLGSYSKENPSLFLEHQLNYKVHEKWNLGVGAGVNLYPAALAYPIYMEGQYRFSCRGLPSYLSQSYGVNLSLGEYSFFSHRYIGNFNVLLLQQKKIQLITGLGYLYIWDHWGGKNISFLLNAGVEF